MRKVLIVEDDKFLAAIFALFIKDMGFDVVGRCRSGAEAVELCNSLEPNVVLMDIHLEGEMDGIQAAEKIQRELEIPVIFISSDTSSSVVERAIISNSYGYLVKPVQRKELEISIELAYYKHKAVIDQKRKEEGFRKFISDAPVPIVIIQDGKILYLNNEALDFFHTHYIEDMMGLPFLSFVEPDHRDRFEKFIATDAQNGKLPGRILVSMKGLHGGTIETDIKGSWICFNGKDALQLFLNDLFLPEAH